MVWYEYAYWTFFIVCRCPSNSFVKWAGLVGVPSFEDGDRVTSKMLYTQCLPPTLSKEHPHIIQLFVFYVFFVNFPDIFNFISFY
jgi:hypothetical protein